MIGTGSGNNGLSIYSGNDSQGRIDFRDTTGTSDGQGIIFYQHTTDSLQIHTNSAERMRIDSSGNVGIGLHQVQHQLFMLMVILEQQIRSGTAANYANIVSYVSGTGSYPPSGGLVQTNNADSTAMFWNASNSANYTGLSIECRTTHAAYWMIANVYNSSFSGDLAFRTRTGGSSNAERVRFLRGGGITFNGDTAAANALDDYEEGRTFTPSYTNVDNGEWITVNHYATQK